MPPKISWNSRAVKIFMKFVRHPKFIGIRTPLKFFPELRAPLKTVLKTLQNY
jgi:hypothetical protein